MGRISTFLLLKHELEKGLVLLLLLSLKLIIKYQGTVGYLECYEFQSTPIIHINILLC